MPEDAKIYALNSDKGDAGSPRIVNGYSLVEEIGRGGTAIAYRALKDRSEFCVREHRFGRMLNDDAFKAHELFEREAEVLQKLDHPMIPKVYDLFDFGDGSNFSIYMVQQLMPGECLQSLVEQNGVFSEEQAVDFMLSLTDVLAYLHGQTPAVVHKDIKPSNIMYDEETGAVSLIDFGILQQAFVETVGGSTTFGTVGYSAPEVFFGQASTKSDLYSIGPTLINLTSGLEPHTLLEGLQIGYKDKFRFKNPSLEVIVDQLLQFNPDSRPENAEKVAEYLEQIKAGKRLSKPKENAGRVKKFFASFIPDSLVRFLVRDRAGVVEEEQRTNGLLASAGNGSAPSYPRIRATNGEARIEKTDEYWIYQNVPVFGKDGSIEEKVLPVTRELLFDGEASRQEQYVKKLEGTELSLLTAPEYLAICAFLNSNQDHPDTEQRKLFAENKVWLADLFRKYWLMTGTRPVFRPDGSGRVIQGLGREDQYVVEVPELVGPDGWLKKLEGVGSAMRGIFHTGDIGCIDTNFKGVSGKDSYFWRINSKPSQEQEWPVVLGVDDYGNRFNFNVYSRFDNSRRALGVVTPRAEKSP